MCGRFIMIPKDELNRIIADVKKNLQAQQHANVSVSYQDVYPKAEVPIIVPDAGRLEVAVMKWGYERSWSKVPLFNTRADTATGKKGNMWEDSLEHRRCIIPTYGFYEPHKTDTHPSPKTGKPIKDQYYFHLPDSKILLMAGVYEDGHFSIMTAEPNRWMKDIHPRMPVVLRPDEVDTWLGKSYSTLFDRSDIELLSRKEAA